MGEVYRANDPRLKRQVAIKLVPAALREDTGRRRRFEQEAHAVAALNHPNVLAVYDVVVRTATSFPRLTVWPLRAKPARPGASRSAKREPWDRSPSTPWA